jgi:hypothetical protein
MNDLFKFLMGDFVEEVNRAGKMGIAMTRALQGLCVDCGKKLDDDNKDPRCKECRTLDHKLP